MRKLSQKKSALALFCAGAALLLLLLGSLTGILPLLLALLALIAIVPLKDGLRYGIAVWLLVSAVSLLIPGKKDSTLIFALFGYYPLVRDRIVSCKSRALRSGIRFAIILITGTAIFSAMILFCPDLLPPEIADSRGLLLGVYLLVTAIYYLIFDFVIKKASQIYDEITKPSE